MQYFGILYFIISKRFVKSHAGDLTLADAPRSGRPVEVDSDQIETLRTINILSWERQPPYSKYPNQ